jgi:hypothetical protein
MVIVRGWLRTPAFDFPSLSPGRPKRLGLLLSDNPTQLARLVVGGLPSAGEQLVVISFRAAPQAEVREPDHQKRRSDMYRAVLYLTIGTLGDAAAQRHP